MMIELRGLFFMVLSVCLNPYSNGMIIEHKVLNVAYANANKS